MKYSNSDLIKRVDRAKKNKSKLAHLKKRKVRMPIFQRINEQTLIYGNALAVGIQLDDGDRLSDCRYTIKEAKRLHKWLTKAIIYLEQEEQK